MKAVFIKIVAIVKTFGFISTPKALIQLIKPLNNPVATKTGITGMKISPKIRDTFLGKDIPSYRSPLISVFNSVLVFPTTIAYTRSTNPVPRIIWYCSPAKNCPFTPSIFSISASLTTFLSFKVKRKREEQCPTARMFSFPPIASMIAFATITSLF